LLRIYSQTRGCTCIYRVPRVCHEKSWGPRPRTPGAQIGRLDPICNKLYTRLRDVSITQNSSFRPFMLPPLICGGTVARSSFVAFHHGLCTSHALLGYVTRGRMGRNKCLPEDVGALHLCISPLCHARCTTMPLSKFLSCVLITLGYSTYS
jgi:hypothetical protein